MYSPRFPLALVISIVHRLFKKRRSENHIRHSRIYRAHKRISGTRLNSVLWQASIVNQIYLGVHQLNQLGVIFEGQRFFGNPRKIYRCWGMGQSGRLFNASEFSQRFGFNVTLNDSELPRCEISDIEAFHLGGIGQDFINGAVISAMLDFALGLTGLKYAELGDFATSHLNIDIARPIEKGRFYVLAKTNKQIANKVFSEATIFNYRDEPCVYATGSLRVAITSK